jgi:hypothetical protein
MGERAILLGKQSANFGKAMQRFQTLDEEEAVENGDVEEPLAAGGAIFLGDEPDGGVIVEGLAGDAQVVGDFGDAVEFARRMGQGASGCGAIRESDLPHVLADSRPAGLRPVR